MRAPKSTALTLGPPPPHVVCVHSPVVLILVTAKSRAWLNYYMWMKMVRLRSCVGLAPQRLAHASCTQQGLRVGARHSTCLAAGTGMGKLLGSMETRRSQLQHTSLA